MVLELKLRKIGNSVGLVLPKEALAYLRVGEGDTLMLTGAADGSVRLGPANADFVQQMEAAEGIISRYRNTLRELAQMNPPVWILPDTVLALQERLIAEFGGAPGLREPGLLESALARPQHRLTYTEASIPDLAASYAFGLIKNHPFLDGNKRIGFTVAVLFLELNGRRFHAAEVDAIIRTLALAAGELSEPEFAAWLVDNSRPLKTS